MTLRIAMCFGDFSKNISKLFDRRAKSSVTSGVCWKIKAMRCVCLTLSICTAAIVPYNLWRWYDEQGRKEMCPISESKY